jgi:hypothetical protein
MEDDMFAKLYALVWFLIVGVLTALYLGGFVAEQLLVPIGMLAVTLVFIGMVVIVPMQIIRQRG